MQMHDPERRVSFYRLVSLSARGRLAAAGNWLRDWFDWSSRSPVATEQVVL